MDATARLAELDKRRTLVARRLDELDRSQREATQALQQARARLVEAERTDAAPATRGKLESALRTAEARAAEPWGERREGARAALRDADYERRAFIGEHLDALVEEREAAGAECAARINDHLTGLAACYSEWSTIAQQITALASSVAPLRPGDVSYTRVESLIREVEAVLLRGGEEGPRLRHDPRLPRHAQAVPAAAS
jgi:chromosome segregation ATPase